MIKANELRIGNFVSFFNRTHKINGSDINALQNGACYDEYPIAITEEWLLYLGFKKNETLTALNQWILNDIAVQQWENGPWFYCYVAQKEMPELNVHRLQNLYFALTGEEIKIK